MGIIISRFRKKKPTLDVLDDLDKRIRDMEAQSANAIQQYQRVSKGLVLYTVGLYVICAVVWYWYWPPLNYRQQLYRLPVLVFTPVLIFIFRLVVKLYYTRKIRRNEEKLVEMRSKKKQILEEVMDHETYKVARTILERFAPESLGVKSSYVSSLGTPLQMPRKLEALTTSTANRDIRRRVVPVPAGLPTVPSLPATRTSTNSPELRPAMPVAKPYLPFERTFFDRILEFIIGDGPSNRFALICKSCMCHNGMALKEEFEYLQFRCYNCHHWNPARKQRPAAPRLQESPSHNPSIQAAGAMSASNTKPDEDSSSSDSEDDLTEAPPAAEISENKEDCNNETAEMKFERDDRESEETSLEHDSSIPKETGSDVEASQESNEIGSDSETSQKGKKQEEQETPISKCTESTGSDKN